MIADLIVTKLMTVSSTASITRTLIVSGSCGHY